MAVLVGTASFLSKKAEIDSNIGKWTVQTLDDTAATEQPGDKLNKIASKLIEYSKSEGNKKSPCQDIIKGAISAEQFSELDLPIKFVGKKSDKSSK